jgi:hypothetical protein
MSQLAKYKRWFEQSEKAEREGGSNTAAILTFVSLFLLGTILTILNR